MFVVGIDPGLTGAMALLDSRSGLLDCVDLPIEANTTPGGKVSNRIHVQHVAGRLSSWRISHCMVDDVHCSLEQAVPLPRMPSTTTASTFDSYGALRAIFSLKVDEVVTVHPRIWKKYFGLNTDKDESIKTALALYPEAEKFVRLKKHHNRAEAILLAHWLMRRVNG